MLEGMSKESLLDLMGLHIRNIWRVDGLYFLGIEDKFGTEAETKIDADCWKVMGKIEARALKKILSNDGKDPKGFVHLLKHTSWALDILEKEVTIDGNMVIFRVIECGTQKTRLEKGLDIFPCRMVREGYLEAFARELDPQIEMVCRSCPPSKLTDEVWCEWEFKFKEN